MLFEIMLSSIWDYRNTGIEAKFAVYVIHFYAKTSFSGSSSNVNSFLKITIASAYLRIPTKF